MPKIPSYRKQILPSTNVGAAPLPTSAANVAGGAVGQGLAALGGGISNIGQSLVKIVQMDNQNKDSLGTTAYDQIMKNAKNEHKLFMQSEGDETKWEANR